MDRRLIKELFSPCTACSQDWFCIHNDCDQDKDLTDNEQMAERLFLGEELQLCG